MSGFTHDVAGGNGNLIIPALQSPNYVHGVSGWAIFSNGDAEFNDIQIPQGSGGATVYFDGTEPVSPNTGDLWYNTDNGLEVSQWTGTEWVPYQISDGAIAAGTVVPGIIDATTVDAATFIGSVFEGTDFVINEDGAFWYAS